MIREVCALGRAEFERLDFHTDDVAEVLARAGHDAHRPTLFLAEHLALLSSGTG